jgi:hypothetical protein
VTDNTNDHGLHPKVVELARGKNFAALTTLLPGGHPQTQVMWKTPIASSRCAEKS